MDIIIDSHVIARKNAERFCVPFIQCPQLGTSYVTILQNQESETVQSTNYIPISPLATLKCAVFLVLERALDSPHFSAGKTKGQRGCRTSQSQSAKK